MGETTLVEYRVLRSFNVLTRGVITELDPDDDGTRALLRDGYVEPHEGGGEGDDSSVRP